MEVLDRKLSSLTYLLCDALQDVNLMNWTLQRVVDGKTKIVFKFPPNAVLKFGKTIKVSVQLFCFLLLSS